MLSESGVWLIFVLLTSHQGFTTSLTSRRCKFPSGPASLAGVQQWSTCSFTPDINTITCIISVLFHLCDTAAIIKQSSNYNDIRDSHTEWQGNPRPELLGNIAAGSGDGSDTVLGRIGNFDRILFGFLKWTEYKYQIVLFGPNYLNSKQIVNE